MLQSLRRYATDKTIKILYVGGVLVLLGSSVVWWSKVRMDPERVFWGMVANSLSTRGVTVSVEQVGDNDSRLKQHVQFELGARAVAHSFTTVTQAGTEVTSETIGTPTKDYTRYVSIKTDQKGSNGKPLDISNITGVWSEVADQDQSTTQTSGNQLLSQSVLGVSLPVGSLPIPMANLTAEQRQNIMTFMKEGHVYDGSLQDVSKKRVNGHMQYTYTVSVQAIPYVKMMKAFAEYSGFSDLSQIEPNDYQANEALKATIVVDATSRQLVSVASSGVSFTQKYSGHGSAVLIDIPKNPISAQELQKRLSEL